MLEHLTSCLSEVVLSGHRLVTVAHEATVSAAENHLRDPERHNELGVRFIGLRIAKSRWVDQARVRTAIVLDVHRAECCETAPSVESEHSRGDNAGHVEAAESGGAAGSKGAGVERPHSNCEKYGVCCDQQHRHPVKVVDD